MNATIIDDARIDQMLEGLDIEVKTVPCAHCSGDAHLHTAIRQAECRCCRGTGTIDLFPDRKDVELHAILTEIKTRRQAPSRPVQTGWLVRWATICAAVGTLGLAVGVVMISISPQVSTTIAVASLLALAVAVLFGVFVMVEPIARLSRARG